MAWQPPDGGQDPNSTYGSQSNPYGTPQPDPYAAPQDPYGAPQNPYSAPQPDPYSTPQNPYGVPQNPYAVPNQQQGYGYGYAQPTATPLPLGEAVKQLPKQYLRVITHPSPATFAEEMGKASWDIVWIQLIILAVLMALISFLASLVSSGTNAALTGTNTANSQAVQAVTAALTGGLSFFEIIWVPVAFFIGAGIYFGFAKIFKGQGTFLQQCYTGLLYYVPLTIIAGFIGIIPFAGSFVALAAFAYRKVLQIFSFMTVHRMSGGRASAAVLIPLGIFVVLLCGLLVAIILIAAAAINGARHY